MKTSMAARVRALWTAGIERLACFEPLTDASLLQGWRMSA